MHLLVSLVVWVLRAVLTSRRSLALESLALRQQLAAYTRTQKRPRLKSGERAFWVALSKVWRDWRSPLVLVKPATVFIFLDAKHVLRVCREYVEFYNRARPSQALHAIPEPYPEPIAPPRRSGELIALPVLGGVQHDYRLAA
jgi:hypothetical protein